MTQPRTRRCSLPQALLCAGALLLALLGSTGCSGGQQLPEFPKYEQADKFLEMQARLKRYQPPEPQPYPYTDHNQEIYDNLQRDLQTSQAALEFRNQQRDEALRRARGYNQEQWEALQGRLARDEAVNALADAERDENRRVNAIKYGERYERYQSRLEELAQAQEDMARERELNRFRNQERVAAQMEELRKRQLQNVRVQGLSPTPPNGPLPAATGTPGGIAPPGGGESANTTAPGNGGG
jgi:hypothetical protein